LISEALQQVGAGTGNFGQNRFVKLPSGEGNHCWNWCLLTASDIIYFD